MNKSITEKVARESTLNTEEEDNVNEAQPTALAKTGRERGTAVNKAVKEMACTCSLYNVKLLNLVEAPELVVKKEDNGKLGQI